MLYFEAPKWVRDNCVLLYMTGSHSYGTNTPDSDYDYLGVTIPYKEVVLPHTAGKIIGFDKIDEFKSFETSRDNKDIKIYSITQFFKLALECNPNIIGSMFVKPNLINHQTYAGQLILQNRHLFLHKGLYKKFKAYAYSQIRKMENERFGKRKGDIEKYGYDLKFAMNCIRLVFEVEQLLIDGNLDLQKYHVLLCSIKRGEWSKEKVLDFFAEKDKYLDKLFTDTTLPDVPRTDEVRSVLIQCLENHYGNIGINTESKYYGMIEQIRNIVNA